MTVFAGKVSLEQMAQAGFKIRIDVNPLHLENAASPMFVTLPGMLTLVNPLQPENA